MLIDSRGQIHPDPDDAITPAGLVHVAICKDCLERYGGKDDLVLKQIRELIQARERAAEGRGHRLGYQAGLRTHWDAVGQVVALKTRIRKLERKLTARSAALGRVRADLRRLDQRNMELEDRRKD